MIITGDHGVDFDSERHAGAGYGYDLTSAVLHVPLIVHAPFIEPHRFEHVVSTMDIMPTLANLARVPARTVLHGRSLVPELLHGQRERESVVFHQLFLLERRWQGGDPLAAVSLRTERYNLIHDRLHETYELYDYRSDPLESRDLSSTRPETLAALRGLLDGYTYEVHAPAAHHVAVRH